jgi:hypothetical protein
VLYIGTENVYNEMLLIVFEHLLSVEMAFFSDLLWRVGHMLSTCDLIVINTCTGIKQGKWACINKWVFMKQLMYNFKCASDGGESNPVQVADDFTFWNFLPDQQAERSVYSRLILSRDMCAVPASLQ